jgi:hypothetical protein
MAYKLTLTEGERAAFDWVGHRYSNGGEMSAVFCQYLPDGKLWACHGDITFNLPEHAAWEIMELAEQDDNQFPFFAPDLKAKMLSFIDAIV